MADRLTREERSRNMSRIRGKDTAPEQAVRQLLYRMGYRYRLHAGDLPGSPDIVFRGRKKAIYVHGCFWHRHRGCRYAYIPKSRTEFWLTKFARNVERDQQALEAIRSRGWEALVVWECELREPHVLEQGLSAFLKR